MGSPILLKIVSENRFSGKTYFIQLVPGRDAVLADAALLPVALVLQQLVEEHLGPVLAEVVLVHNVWAVGDSTIGAAKCGNLFDLFIIFALALKNKIYNLLRHSIPQ